MDRKIVKNYKEPRSMEERRKNHIALTEEEIQRLANLRLDNNRLEVARDIFLLQCYCGFRFEDLSLLLDGKNLKESEGWKYVDFETQKKDIPSHTPLNHPNYYPQAYEIYEKYVNNSPYTDKHHDKYNKALREVAELAKLDREFTVTSTKGKSKSKKTYKIYEKISSHDGRHTFITNCIRYKGVDPNVLKSITGHADTKLIETVYCNLHEDDKLSVLLNVRMGEKFDDVVTSPKVESTSSCNYGIEGVREAQSVLTYLGVGYGESMNFEELVNLIKDRQYWIADNCGMSVKILKEIYNISLPIKKRVRALQSLIGELMTEV